MYIKKIYDSNCICINLNKDLINFKFDTNSTSSFNFVHEVYLFKNTTKRTAR